MRCRAELALVALAAVLAEAGTVPGTGTGPSQLPSGTGAGPQLRCDQLRLKAFEVKDCPDKCPDVPGLPLLGGCDAGGLQAVFGMFNDSALAAAKEGDLATYRRRGIINCKATIKHTFPPFGDPVANCPTGTGFYALGPIRARNPKFYEHSPLWTMPREQPTDERCWFEISYIVAK
eukprot:gene11542-10016_t